VTTAGQAGSRVATWSREDQAINTLNNIGGTDTLARLAHEELATYLAEGGLAAGERLVEAQLAEMLGISRGPIRQALQQLAAEGWVEIRPRLGAYVARRDKKAAEDFFAVRHELEVIAVGLAAAHRTDADLASLRTCLDWADELAAQLGPAETDADRHRLARAFHRDTSVRFHECLTEASHNETLRDVLRVLVKKTRWYFSPGVLHNSQRAWAEHRELVAAVEKQDVDLARQLMRRHMDNTLASYLENMD
jgi:DNA-binding GntR family transcriptional regulator